MGDDFDEAYSENVHRIAAQFHEVYEAQAAAIGWSTQETTRVAFDDLPLGNKLTMLATVGSLIGRGVIAIGPRAGVSGSPNHKETE